MTAITASEARRTLFPLIARVNDDHEPVEIVAKGGNAVLISKADYDAIVETEFISRDPANLAWIARGVEQADRGEFVDLDLNAL